MRRASPSPGTPFSVLTGPTSGFLRRPVLHCVHTPRGRNLQPCEYRCDVSGPTPSRPVLIKHGHSAEVVARRFFFWLPCPSGVSRRKEHGPCSRNDLQTRDTPCGGPAAANSTQARFDAC
jgi:hypothetical protein